MPIAVDIRSGEGQAQARRADAAGASPLREHLVGQNTDRQAAGNAWDDWDLVWCGP
jgi:hypothetical protein